LTELAALYKKAARANEGVKEATCSPATFRKWIRGERIPEPFSQRCISAGLDIPIEHLTDAIAAQRAQFSQRPPVRADVDSADVKRREFAAFLALAGISASTGLDLDRFGAILSGTPVDEPALDDLETLTLDFVRREATLAPASLLPAVRGHLAGLRDMLVWAPPALAPRAYSLAGQTSLLAGYLWFKQYKHSEADLYWSLADRLGDMAGDARLRAAVLVLRAMNTDHGQPPTVPLALLDRAESLLGAVPDPASAALLLSRRAPRRAEASQADPFYAALALRDLDDAQSHLSRVDAPAHSLYIFESLAGETTERRAETLLHLDRARDAAGEFESLLASMDPSWLSWRSCTTSYLAAAAAQTGDPEHASELLLSALDLATEASAPRNIERVRAYRQRWLGQYDGPAVRRLDEQLATIAPASKAGQGRMVP
jgi:hypothetical protein